MDIGCGIYITVCGILFAIADILVFYIGWNSKFPINRFVMISMAIGIPIIMIGFIVYVYKSNKWRH